jgi:hypothetical protein
MKKSKETELIRQLNNIVTYLTENSTDLTAIITLANELKADLNLMYDNGECYGACGLAEGTNANTLQVANAFSYRIGNLIYTKAITDNIAMTAAAVQAVSTFCKYLVSIDAAGAVTVTKGTEVATDASVLPAVPASECAIGYFNIATDGATTFTSGTTDLGAAGITETFVDLAFAFNGADAPSAIAAADATGVSASVPSSIPE